MTTAFVLSGGGSLAAVQVGMMQALSERGIHPDMLVGTSAGAVNAAFVGAYGAGPDALEDLARLWRGLRRSTVFPLRADRGLLAAVGARDSLCSPEPLARLLADALPYTRLEHASVPVHVVATDVLTGRGVLLSAGDAISALLASCAIPGVYPVVHRDGLALCDGALADVSGTMRSVELGADRIYVLTAGSACGLDGAPRHPVSAALHALTLLLQQRVVADARAITGALEVYVIPPLCPLTVAASDFGHAAALIQRARRVTADWLQSGSDELLAPAPFPVQHTPRPHAGQHSATARSARLRADAPPLSEPGDSNPSAAVAG
jgi:NTE family protein